LRAVTRRDAGSSGISTTARSSGWSRSACQIAHGLRPSSLDDGFRVTDDGRGGAQLGVMSGLTDRVAALGGSLQVASPRGGGTKVEAALPCAS
jgi:glucose-6-phosphate-specific signal transduction histidine kinase